MKEQFYKVHKQMSSPMRKYFISIFLQNYNDVTEKLKRCCAR